MTRRNRVIAAGAAAVTAVVVGVSLGDSGSEPGNGPTSEAFAEPTTAGPPSEVETRSPPGEPTTRAPTPLVPSAAPTVPPPATAQSLWLVTVLDDGDSFDVVRDGREETVRMAQVDAPELGACHADEAAAWLAGRIKGERVALEPTTNGPDRDRHGRLVREVWHDGTSINVEIVRLGHARHAESFAHEDPELAGRMAAAEEHARTNGLGLWTACANEPPAGGGVHTGRTDGGWTCHPAYRECLPSHLDDLDCFEIGHQVVLFSNEDPWRLDGNNTHRTDGVGCDTFPPWSSNATYPYY